MLPEGREREKVTDEITAGVGCPHPYRYNSSLTGI